MTRRAFHFQRGKGAGVSRYQLRTQYGSGRGCQKGLPDPIKAEGLDRIARSRENEAKRYLLAECFDHYLRLGESEQSEFERFQTEPPEKLEELVPAVLDAKSIQDLEILT